MAHAWAVRSFPRRGRVGGNQLMFVSHMDVLSTPLPSSLSKIGKNMFKKKSGPS